MKIILMILSVICIGLGNNPVVAQKLYAVCFAATFDKTIGRSCEIDAAHFENEFKTLQQHLGYQVNVKVFKGNDCKASVLYNYLDNLHTSDDDIIVLYYSGHGGRNINDVNDKFPQMDMHNEPSQNYVPVKKVRNILSQKLSRLRLIIADCCNKEDDRYAPTTRRVRTLPKGQTIIKDEQNQNLRKLFLDFKGEVVLSGSKAGQYSYGDTIVGGICTSELFLALNAAAEGTISPTWNAVCAVTQKQVKESTQIQIPEYEINLTSFGGYNPNPDPAPYVDDNLSSAFKSLIDKNKSLDSRIDMANSVFNSYFTSGAKVAVFGRDMKTIVDYVDAESYLRRICMSPTIIQVNILNSTEQGGKKNYLKVHEVRKQL